MPLLNPFLFAMDCGICLMICSAVLNWNILLVKNTAASIINLVILGMIILMTNFLLLVVMIANAFSIHFVRFWKWHWDYELWLEAIGQLIGQSQRDTRIETSRMSHYITVLYQTTPAAACHERHTHTGFQISKFENIFL